MLGKIFAKRRVKRRIKNAREVLRCHDPEFERTCSDAFCAVFYLNFVTVMTMQGPEVAMIHMQDIVTDTLDQMEDLTT